MKIQDQVAHIFTKPLKHDIFAKVRDMLRVIKKSSLKGDVESKLDFNFLKKTEESVY